jgi:hypothetical protein
MMYHVTMQIKALSSLRDLQHQGLTGIAAAAKAASATQHPIG